MGTIEYKLPADNASRAFHSLDRDREIFNVRHMVLEVDEEFSNGTLLVTAPEEAYSRIDSEVDFFRYSI